ncbi:hypothetical protein PR202_ga19992 [Eleusine coracana subsp. coracana]|uniref:Uncharacterized protein n=1 Tax=Eleusine coracana subsp. coracana TaxID=191504 RepID=A0AAV5CXI3_ELECO|nr:hypothetical protein PR202_ga19992 [Eleusine coracana subsp. coracana]
MCMLSGKREHVGCFLLVALVIALIIGVLFGLGVFRHGYEHVRDIGRNHTCFDCNTTARFCGCLHKDETMLRCNCTPVRRITFVPDQHYGHVTVRVRVASRPRTIRFRRAWHNKAKEPATLADAMCKFSLKKQHVGGFLLVVLVIALIIGVLFGLGIFKHGYERIKDMGRNHTCYDCNTG